MVGRGWVRKTRAGPEALVHQPIAERPICSNTNGPESYYSNAITPVEECRRQLATTALIPGTQALARYAVTLWVNGGAKGTSLEPCG